MPTNIWRETKNRDLKVIDNAPGLIPEYFTATSPITDYAGNSLDIHTKDLTSYSLLVDKKVPEIDSVEIAGNMIAADSTSYSQPSDWLKILTRAVCLQVSEIH